MNHPQRGGRRNIDFESLRLLWLKGGEDLRQAKSRGHHFGLWRDQQGWTWTNMARPVEQTMHTNVYHFIMSLL